MNNTVKVIPRPTGFGINPFSLAIGEYGRTVDGKNVLLRVRTGVVNLTDPSQFWDTQFMAPNVERLQTGDRIEIAVGFTTEFANRIYATAKNNNKIQAIKEVLEATNWGLKESKDYVESLLLSF